MTGPTTIWRAHVSSRHFDFEAYGLTQETARNALLGALRLHGRLPEADYRYMVGLIDDANVEAFDLGVGYRDGSPISGARA